MLRSIYSTKMNGKKGFTLIELMIVIAIIGIVSSIAIPQYSAYRKRAYDKAALAQIRDMAAAEEAYFSDNGAYTISLTDLKNYGFIQDPLVTRTRAMLDSSGTPNPRAYQLTATHTLGTGKTYLWMSDNGGLQ